MSSLYGCLKLYIACYRVPEWQYIPRYRSPKGITGPLSRILSLGCLFKVPRLYLERDSPISRDMFKLLTEKADELTNNLQSLFLAVLVPQEFPSVDSDECPFTDLTGAIKDDSHHSGMSPLTSRLKVVCSKYRDCILNVIPLSFETCFNC